MTSYTVLLDLGFTDPEPFDLGRFADYHAVLAAGVSDHTELVLTVEAGTMRQAISAALLDAIERLGFEPHGARVLATAAFDAGQDIADATQTISVAQTAELLGVTPSAVRQRLKSKSIAGYTDGRDWRVNSRIANLYDGERHIARLRVPAGQHTIVHDGDRYRATGGGHSVGGQPLAYTYLRDTDDERPTATYTTRSEAIEREIVAAINAGDASADEYDVDAIALEVLVSTTDGYSLGVDEETFWASVERHVL